MQTTRNSICLAAIFAVNLLACDGSDTNNTPSDSDVPTALPEPMGFGDCEIDGVSPAEWAASLDMVVTGTVSAVAAFGSDDSCDENTVYGMEIQMESVESLAGAAPTETITFVVPGSQINDWLPQPVWDGDTVSWFPPSFEGAIAPGMSIVAGLTEIGERYVTPGTHLGLVTPDGIEFQGSQVDACISAPIGETVALSDFGGTDETRDDVVAELTASFEVAARAVAEQNYVRCTSNGEPFDDPCETQTDCLSSQTCTDGSCIDN